MPSLLGAIDQPYRARLSRISQIENKTPHPSRRASSNAGATFSDRFIPARSLNSTENAVGVRSISPQTVQTDTSPSKNGGLFAMLLRSELLGEEIPSSAAVAAAVGNNNGPTSPNQRTAQQDRTPPSTPSRHDNAPSSTAQTATTPSVLRFRRSIQNGLDSLQSPADATASPLSPLRSSTSRSLLQSPLVTPGGRSRRKIPKTPFKVLDAPGLADDFYLNNVDWSARNIVAVGLGSSIYLWSAHTSKAVKLDDIAAPQTEGGRATDDEVACVNYTEAGSVLAVGTRAGKVLLYDVERCEVIRTYEEAHASRVGCASWSGPILATGSRDKRIRERDTRCSDRHALIRDVTAHRQEVCGLKYSFEGFSGPHRQLASGGNDNKLYVWDARRADQTPLHRFSDHSAAVKALAWNPHQTGVLASGGGTADRCIKQWSTLNGTCLSSVDTGSQVCGLVYSKTVQELVSTHGYSLNQICVWRASNPQTMPLQKLATLQGHTLRVLYLALSPDGSTVVTGAGDESLRFWSIWPGRSSTTGAGGSKLGDMMMLSSAPGAFLR